MAVAEGQAEETAGSPTKVGVCRFNIGFRMLTLHGHTGSVECVAFSPAEPILISTGSDRHIRVWDIASAQGIRAFLGGKEQLYSLAVSPDGKAIATGGIDEEVRLLEIETGEVRWAAPGHFPAVTALAFSPDGETLAVAVGDRFSGSERGEVKLWDVRTGQWQSDLLSHITHVEGWPQGTAWSLSYSPDGKLLAIGTGAQNVVFWDVEVGRVRGYLRQGTGVRALAFAPDGSGVATACGYVAKTWDSATRTERLELRGHHGWIWSLAFSPDSRILATGSRDQTTRLWNAADGRELTSYNWQAGKVNSVAFAADGMTAAAGCDSGAVVMWDVDVSPNG
jgi:WD40 repeat protein